MADDSGAGLWASLIAIGIGVYYFYPWDPAPKLAECLKNTEQTILLRKMAADSITKSNFETCRTGFMPQSDAYCSALYLNANTIVRECMEKSGYTLVESTADRGCGWSAYSDATCYTGTVSHTVVSKFNEMAASKR